MAALKETRFFLLDKGIKNDSQVFRMQKGSALQFFLGPTVVGSKVRLFVDHPIETGLKEKKAYRELEWTVPPDGRLDVCEGHAEVTLVEAGSFRYYFTLDGSDDIERADGFGFFQVDPQLMVGKELKQLPLDGIICQTVLSKLLGPFPEWKDRLLVAKHSGYNAIHFTPLQALGASDSAYALNDLFDLNPSFSTDDDRKIDLDDVEQFVRYLNTELEMLSFTDLVFNHIATESDWLSAHPECIYNLNNSPHLKPAYILDRRLMLFSDEVANGIWEKSGIPPLLSDEFQLEGIVEVLQNSVLPELKLEQFFQVSIDSVISQFKSLITQSELTEVEYEASSELQIFPGLSYHRLQGSVDLCLAKELFYGPQHPDCSEDARILSACSNLRSELERLNEVAKANMMDHLSAAVQNFVASARYCFVDRNGLRLGRVTSEQKMMNRYFVSPFGRLDMSQEEALIHDVERNRFCMAHNGWVGNIENPILGFGGPNSNAYLRRELNSWEDSVKLWYGKSYDDCPFLWDEMRRYVRRTAEIFDGVRIDNCHNTPIHVAEWMLAEARSVKPDLYVMGELFTPNDYFDGVYINRLGLNSMICESFSVNSPYDLGRWLCRHSAKPVGSFLRAPLRPFINQMPCNILYDQTHDNPSIVEKRSALDVLPTAALVSMTTCAIGSTRGYDEIVPNQISVITERRLYRSWSEDVSYGRARHVGAATGIIRARKALNELHRVLSVEGFSEFSAEHVADAILVAVRQNPFTRDSVLLFAHTAFHGRGDESKTSTIPGYSIHGTVRKILLEARLDIDWGGASVSVEELLCGLENVHLCLQENIDVCCSEMIKLDSSGDVQLVKFINFPPGSVAILRLSLDDRAQSSLVHLHQLLSGFGYNLQLPDSEEYQIAVSAKISEAEEIVRRLSLGDLNWILFRCDAEEQGEGGGVYHVPQFGDLLFCGLAGVNSVMIDVRTRNDTDHPICGNLKNGDWLMDYETTRLLGHRGTREFGLWLADQFQHVKKLPRSLVPPYFDALLMNVCVALEELAWRKMSSFIRDGSTSVRALGLASLQVCGTSKSGGIPPLSPNLAPPCPTATADGENGDSTADCITIAAGLPYFSTGAFRCWGRDTFISLRGLLLITGRFQEARYLILAFAGCLRYGLIPNFLGANSHEARYNSRDAVWWWLLAIQDYSKMAPDGINILRDKVLRIYDADDKPVLENDRYDQPLCEVIHESLERHAAGARFSDSTGREIDHNMTDDGFEVTFGIDWDTGFVYGGNEHNCGTWMDKMGSSARAGNLGKAATPRDGTAVELVGLSYSAVKWLAELSDLHEYPHSGVSFVKDGIEKQITFEFWRDLIARNFETRFWIGDDPENDPHPDLVNRRCVYRDVYRCSRIWSEYQFRPNFSIAIVTALDLFDLRHAWGALQSAKTILLGPLGIKTLDPKDHEYVGYYDNSDSSSDFRTAHGFSYHQGPEWIWPVGFFLRALIQVAWRLNESQPGILREAVTEVRQILATHHAFIHASGWKSLPELTDKDGQFCKWSCPSQAWSIGSILDAHFDCELALQFLKDQLSNS